MSNKTIPFRYKIRRKPVDEPPGIDVESSIWFFCPQCGINVYQDVYTVALLVIEGKGLQEKAEKITLQRCIKCGWVGNIFKEGVQQTLKERQEVLAMRAEAQKAKGEQREMIYWEAEA